MARSDKRVKVTLACEVCKRRNYITMKNKQNDRERIQMKKHRHEALEDEAPLADTRPEHDPEAAGDAELLRSRLNDALEELPPRLRAVVVLRDMYDLPHQAIADELGISEAAAKVRLHRARRRLRERLFPKSEEESAHAV